MGKITSGYVTYGRTLNLGDYNSKKAEVQISFESDAGDHDKMLALASTTAIAKVHELLALATPPAAASKPITQSTGGASKADLEEAAKKAAGATAEVAKPPKSAKPPKPAKVEVDPAAVDDGPEVITLVEATANSEDDMTDILGDGAPKPDVTDEELTTKVTRKASESKNTKAIRELVAKYAGPVPSGVRQVPKDKRHEFLDELAKITAPT